MDVRLFFHFLGWMLASAACNPKQRLVADLFRNYEKRVEPFGPNTILDVEMDLSLVQISDVDEVKQVLTTNCWINLHWIDAGLAWQPEKYENVTDMRIPADAIWTPDLRLKNAAEEYNQISSSGQINAVLRSSGNVFVSYQVILKISCEINVASFPMDQQECRMLFETWTYQGDRLNISNGEPGVAQLNEYLPSAEWEMISFDKDRWVLYYSCCPEPYITLLYIVTLRRRYYAMNIIIVSLSICLAVFTLNIHHRGMRGHKLPRFVKRVCFGFLARILLIKIDLPETTDENMALLPADDKAMDEGRPTPTMTEGQPSGGNNVVDVLNRLLHTVEKATDLHKKMITTQDALDEATYEWKQLGIVLERALMITFLVITLCTTFIMFL
ncbi:neuronal acetylcholine receptor subunit alpha-10-like [Haliotis asinina]|uniref:neuronal acetylcholine receptor subunit alpha-10-like n=1 Tax=Haliotis asinina TaxID=109174 RepID=UPI0035321E1B